MRLVKVEIPAYKFRGESALLECVYELNGAGGIGQVVVGGSSNSRTRGWDNVGGGPYYAARHRQPLEYIGNHQESGEEDGGVVEEEFKYAKRKRKKYARYRKFNAKGNGEEVEDVEDGDEDQDDAEEEQEFEEKGGHPEDFDEPHYPSSSSMNNGFPETLYSVKWYKDNEEFYRYVPKANPPQNSYKVEGIRVDVSR